MRYKLISFVVPMYNEAKTIMPILNKLLALDIGYKKEIVIVDDGSIDDSVKIVRGILKKFPEIRLIVHKENSGKGAALQTGFRNIKGDIVAIQDADLEYNVEDFRKLIKPIINGETKAVYGSRFLKKNNKGNKMFYFGNRFLSLITSVLYFSRVTDMETCYKVFDRSVVEKLNIESRGFDVEPEITSKILKKGYKIVELPIDYFPRTVNDGKKIRINDGFRALWTLVKYRLSD